jgi:hypothetical protein
MLDSNNGSSPFRALGLTIGFCALAWLIPMVLEAQDNPHGDDDLDCAGCHTTEGWSPLADPIEFDHAETGFPLEQGHGKAECVSCHQSLVFSYVPTACVDCHSDPHRGELGFDCEGCHRPSGWDNRRSIWDIHGATLFPLTGVHATLDCASCHRREPPFEYALTPTDCFSCHLQDYQRADEPDHVSAGFPTECQFCHNTIEWDDADFGGGFGFDHSAFFQLTGTHATLDCSDCHVDGFAGTPTDCVGCHISDYNATRDPNHQQSGFSTNCEDCHGTVSWEGAVVDHQSFFPLTGQHRGLDCSDCHQNGFEGTPTDCVACHRDDYNATSDPNHAQAGFGTNCEDCHNTNGWEGAVVNHDAFFRLTGSHRNLDCDECHSDGFAGTPTDCYACHRDDYNATNDPDHEAAGFPRDCEECHNTNSRSGASINHPQFPIGPGSEHREGSVWNSCSDCHPNPSNFGVFDCLSCHERDEMDDEHEDEDGYVYQSPACLDCHPTGEE